MPYAYKSKKQFHADLERVREMYVGGYFGAGLGVGIAHVRTYAVEPYVTNPISRASKGGQINSLKSQLNSLEKKLRKERISKLKVQLLEELRESYPDLKGVEKIAEPVIAEYIR